MVPMLQRYFGLELTQAAMSVGVIVGVTGLIALPLGGWIADRLHVRVRNGRLLFGAVSLLLTCVFTGVALVAGEIDVAIFVGLFAVGWLFAYNFYTCVYTAVQDVIEPRLDRKSTRLNSSHVRISYAVFCLKKKKKNK